MLICLTMEPECLKVKEFRDEQMNTQDPPLSGYIASHICFFFFPLTFKESRTLKRVLHLNPEINPLFSQQLLGT